MRTEIIMPQMGESIAEGTVVKWLKQPGDAVKRDEELFEISTDKVESVIPSPVTGFVAELIVGAGEKVAVGTVLGYITDSQDDITEGGGAASSSDSAPAPQASAAPDRDAAPAKASEAPAAAVTGDLPSKAPHGADASASASAESLRRTRSTPLVRRIAAEHNVDIRHITGTGLSGRVTKKDILAFIKAGKPAPAGAQRAAAPSAIAHVEAPPVPIGPNDRVERLSVMRQNIADHMVMSRRVSAHCQTVHECDVTHVEALRRKHKQAYADKGVKLSFTAFLVKAVSDALRAYPLMNASLAGDQVVYRADVNVGVAVALEQGLIVPVVKQTDEKTMAGLARAVNDVSSRARTKQLLPGDVQDGTFTISNAGIFGSLFGIPIINQPQVGILGVGGIHKRVRVFDNDAIGVRSIVTFCLTFDHRLIDGSIADGFMNAIKDTLESFPENIL